MSNTTVPDLTSIVIALSTDAANTMASLYDLQTALINAHGSYSSGLIADFSNIKGPLMNDWKDILSFLQRCHTFGGDISTLNESLQTQRPAECAQFLVETSQLAKILLEVSQSLLSNSEERLKTLERYAPDFVQQLKHPVLRRPLEASSIDLDHIYSFVAAKIRSYVPNVFGYIAAFREPRAVIASNETQIFADACLAAAYPDGKKALQEAQIALHGISSALQTNCQFWQATCRVLEGYLADYNHNDGPIRSIGAAQHLAKSWEGYQISLNAAIVSIAKSSDAFAIDAIGASPPRNSFPRTYSHDNQNPYMGQRAGDPTQRYMKALPPTPSTDSSPAPPRPPPRRSSTGKYVVDSNFGPGNLDV